MLLNTTPFPCFLYFVLIVIRVIGLTFTGFIGFYFKVEAIEVKVIHLRIDMDRVIGFMIEVLGYLLVHPVIRF